MSALDRALEILGMDVLSYRDIAKEAAVELAKLRKENSQLTDALYQEAKRTVETYALIQRVLYAKVTDTLERLDIKPFLEWVEAFPKLPALCKHGNKSENCAHCHPRWD